MPEEAPVPTRRSSTPISSCSGAPTPVKPIRSSSITSSRVCATVLACSPSTRVARRRRSGPMCGWGSKSAPTSRSPTPSHVRSSTRDGTISPSSSTPPSDSPSSPPRSSPTPSSTPSPSPAFPPLPSPALPTPTRRRLQHNCCGPSVSPSTTTPATTSSPCATSHCSPVTSADGVRVWSRSVVRTTCRAVATWARCRTSCPASPTSPTPTPVLDTKPCGACRCHPIPACISRSCSRPWNARSCAPSGSSAKTRPTPRPTSPMPAPYSRDSTRSW